MNEKIDLTKILRDCPKGTKLYSLLHGEVLFRGIDENSDYPIVYDIIFSTDIINMYSITRNGTYSNKYNGECILFPSKDQRDWSKFSAPWYKKEKFDPKTLKPFDKVLVRDDVSGDCWRCSLYSHTRGKEESTRYRYATTGDSYTFCIPYNDETKHLVGTTDEAPEYYRYWED